MKRIMRTIQFGIMAVIVLCIASVSSADSITTNDGVKIYYEEQGQGKPLVLIHGWNCTGKFFKRNVDELSKSCRVINLDLRGHGQSEKPEWGIRLARMSRDVKDLIEALNLDDVTLCGWSMGAGVVWSYYDLFRDEHLSKLIVIDQTPRMYRTPAWTLVGALPDALALARLQTQLEYDPKGIAEWLVAACVGGEPTPEEVEYFAAEQLKCPVQVKSTIMEDHATRDWRDLLSQIRIPCLVITGKKSKIFPWESSAYVAEKTPGAELVVFENSGHMPFYEEAEKFNRIVADFVSE